MLALSVQHAGGERTYRWYADHDAAPFETDLGGDSSWQRPSAIVGPHRGTLFGCRGRRRRTPTLERATSRIPPTLRSNLEVGYLRVVVLGSCHRPLGSDAYDEMRAPVVALLDFEAVENLDEPAATPREAHVCGCRSRGSRRGRRGASLDSSSRRGRADLTRSARSAPASTRVYPRPVNSMRCCRRDARRRMPIVMSLHHTQTRVVCEN